MSFPRTTAMSLRSSLRRGGDRERRPTSQTRVSRGRGGTHLSADATRYRTEAASALHELRQARRDGDAIDEGPVWTLEVLAQEASELAQASATRHTWLAYLDAEVLSRARSTSSSSWTTSASRTGWPWWGGCGSNPQHRDDFPSLGGEGGARTHNPGMMIPPTERLSKPWWGGWGSNPRPRDYESPALTG